MPRNGSGTYTLPAGNPVVTGTTISSTVQNNTTSDIATALTASIAKDGQTTPTANLPMGTFRHTGVGDGVNRTDYTSLGQTQDGLINWVDSAGTADAITATYSPTVTALSDGQIFYVRAGFANATTTPTFSPNGLTARTIVKTGGVALSAGDIVGNGHELILRYDLTGTRYELLNPGTAVNATNATNLIGSGTISSTTTGTTQAQGDNSTKIATTAYVDSSSASNSRQTVLSGPVDSSGFSSFGGSTGSTTVTASGTLKISAAAGGSLNYVGSITNPSWTGLSTNGTMFLYLDITSAGVVTTDSATIEPVYQFGGTYSTTNGQNTFNIQEMTMKVGNGSAATQVYRVFVGEVAVAGNVTTSITWYALMGRYVSGYTNTLPGLASSISKNHNIGTTLVITGLRVKNLTTEGSYQVGDVENAPWRQSGASNSSVIVPVVRSRNSMQASTGNTLAVGGFDPTNGGAFGMTAAYWAYELWAQRTF